MLGLDSDYSAGQPQVKVWRFSEKNRKKSAVKHSIEKAILLNFVNMSTSFCPRLRVTLLSKRILSENYFI